MKLISAGLSLLYSQALTVLEYMVGHGSERVIEEIKERAYQISVMKT